MTSPAFQYTGPPGGDGGGMAETLWARATVDITAGPGAGTSPATAWDAFVDSLGVGPPTVEAGDPTQLRINATGYYLVTVTAECLDALAAGEEFTADFRNGAFSANTFSVSWPYVDNGIQIPVFGVVPMHLFGDPGPGNASELSIGFTYAGFLAAHTIRFTVGVSLIGAMVGDAASGFPPAIV